MATLSAVLAPRHRLPVARVEHLASAALAKDGDALASQIWARYKSCRTSAGHGDIRPVDCPTLIADEADIVKHITSEL